MSDLTITRLEATLVEGPRPWLFVEIETDAGVTGIGEVPRTTHEPEDVVRVGSALLGADPFETETFCGAGGRLGAAANDIFTTTIAGGLDMACWDVKGNHLGVPVHALLGGARTTELRAYANGWDFPARAIVDRYHDGEDRDAVLGDVTDELREAADRVVEAGYTALKFSPFQWGHGQATAEWEVDAAIQAIDAVASTVPSHVDLLIEGHKHLGTNQALSAARRLEQYRPAFYEEPVPADIGPLAQVARRSPVPIATGESFTTHHAFGDLLDAADVSVVQPDIGRAGGITELRKIAAMASARRVGLAPHNAAGPVMTHAAAHVGATTPAFMIQETFEEFFHPDWATDLLVEPLDITDGFITVPDRSGLGVALDRDVLSEHRLASAEASA